MGNSWDLTPEQLQKVRDYDRQRAEELKKKQEAADAEDVEDVEDAEDAEKGDDRDHPERKTDDENIR